MSQEKDLTGMRFGKLTVVGQVSEGKRGAVVWECECDCGNTTFATTSRLSSGRRKSCGCLRKNDLPDDITGLQFGRLTVIRKAEKLYKDKLPAWECQCDCGNTTVVAEINLRSGGTRSCGCLKHRNITGEKFGKLTAIRPIEERKRGAIIWECKCDCGKVALVAFGSLTSGNTKSCGCLAEEYKNKRKRIFEGARFGMLTVVRSVEESPYGSRLWECKCDCGNTTVVANSNLYGRTKSCGCLRGWKPGDDLTGMRFGRLTVVGQTSERSRGAVVWECKCDCGSTVFVPRGSLIGGSKKSCGCLRKGRKSKKKEYDG